MITPAQDFTDMLARIYQGTHTKTQEQLAKVLNVQQSTISDAKRRAVIPEAWFYRLFTSHNLNPEWIRTGQGNAQLVATSEADALKEIALSNSPSSFSQNKLIPLPTQRVTQVLAENVAVIQNGFKPSGTIIVPVFSPCYAGLVDEDNKKIFDILETIPFPQSFITSSSIQVFRLFDKSMEPTLQNNALLGVDKSQKNIVAGEVFAFCLPPQGVIFSRVFYPTTGNNSLELADVQITLTTDNSNFPNITLPFKDAQENILGRVVWTLQNI